MNEDNIKTPMPRYPTENLCARERAAGILHNRARRYQEYAVELLKLADWAGGLNDAQDEALWKILTGFEPR